MRLHDLTRRHLIGLLAGAGAWPLAVRAQQAMPIIGFLHAGSAGIAAHVLMAFRQGLATGGYEEGRNVAFEHRHAQGKYELFSDLAAELVRLKVDVIVTPGNTPATLAAKQATSTIPIVFMNAPDPVALGRAPRRHVHDEPGRAVSRLARDGRVGAVHRPGAT